MPNGIDPRLTRKRNRLVRTIRSATDNRGDVQDALDDIEDAFDDYRDEVEDLDQYNEDLYQHTLELYEVTEDLADRLSQRNREIDSHTEARIRDIADDMEDLLDDVDVDDRGKRNGLLWLITGGALVGSGGVLGHWLWDNRGNQTSGNPPGLSRPLDVDDYDFNFKGNLEGYSSTLTSRSGIDQTAANMGKELDDDITVNSDVEDWYLGFKDEYLKLDTVDSEGYDEEEWGLVHLYDPDTNTLEGTGEWILPKQAYEDAKDIAGNYGGGS